MPESNHTPAPIGADTALAPLRHLHDNFARGVMPGTAQVKGIATSVLAPAIAALERAALASAAQPAAVPHGYVLVPEVPTDDMLKAADDGDDAYTLRVFGPGVQRVMQGPHDHYVAMLAAAPKAAPAQPAQQSGTAYAELPMQFACSGVHPVYSADQMRAFADGTHALRTQHIVCREFLERMLSAMEGVIDVADRQTDEFEALRSCVVDLTLMLFKPEALRASRGQAPAPAAVAEPSWEALHHAWMKIGADVAGLDWGAFTHAVHYAPTAQAAPAPAAQGDAQQRAMDARHASIYRWIIQHIDKAASIIDAWREDGEADKDELHDALAARAAKEGGA